MTANHRWHVVCWLCMALLTNPLAADAAVKGKKFRKAVASGDMGKVSKLLQKEPTDEVILSGVNTAVVLDHDDIVELLLQRVEPESRHMLTAIRRDDFDLVKILIDAGSDPSAQDPVASIRGREVSGGYEYEKYEDPRGWTPLALAVKEQNHAIVSVLLEAGADPNVRVVSKPGKARTSLNFSSMAIGAKMTVAGLGNHGVGEATITTPLILSVTGADGAIVDLLMSSGADPNQTGGNGETACGVATEADSKSLQDLVCNEEA